MKSKILLLMSLVTTLGATAATYPQDKITARDGSQITLTFYKHASLMIEHNGKYIYIDPVSGFADYTSQPKADLILITHSHDDHLDPKAVGLLRKEGTLIVADNTSSEKLGDACTAVAPGASITPLSGVEIETLPAYNITEGHLQFHPRERNDVGYLLTLGGTRIYIAGDTEDTPEVKALRNIDIAFLPVNQPYTMTVSQAVNAVKAMRPTVFYPYHYGEVEEVTDLGRLQEELRAITEVRIRPME